MCPAFSSPLPSAGQSQNASLSGDYNQNEWVSQGKINLEINFKNRGSETQPQAGLKKMTAWKRVASQMMENLPLEHGKGCFLFFSCLFLRVNTKQQARLLYEYLLHTWGGVRGAARDGA